MFLDTSGLLAFLDSADLVNHQAVPLLKSARSRFTHSYVLAELMPLARTRRFDSRETLNFLVDVVDNPDFKVIWVTEADHRAGVRLLKARPDKQYSLCDAVSFILMRRFNLTDALTTDHHFEQEGFVRLLRP